MIHPDHVISMTELQKLSLKKLRKTRLPLVVVDQKSKRKGFVILDYPSYEILKNPVKQIMSVHAAPKKMEDYRKSGLLWDRPDVSSASFHSFLKDPSHQEYPWAFQRLLEYARSSVVTKILSLEELKYGLSRVTLRPIFQEAWSRAVHYWSQKT